MQCKRMAKIQDGSLNTGNIYNSASIQNIYEFSMDLPMFSRSMNRDETILDYNVLFKQKSQIQMKAQKPGIIITQ